MNPKYPIYIISKGRADTRMTSKALEFMKVPYRIVIEPHEYDKYAAVINPKKIIVLPFSNLGLGGIPARNFVWEHSIKEGHERHWILDDNIKGFIRFNKNKKHFVDSGVTFKCIEDFVDRYENIKMAGMNYMYFAPAIKKANPYTLNTRIYSCILLSNDIKHRWRGRYNEDTDLSLRILKDGYCTVLFKAFLCDKASTGVVAGGNTTELYKETTNNRLEFAQSLVDQHPDVAKVVWRYKRWHHEVDYRRFEKNKLIKKPGINIPDLVNNYGMELTEIKEKNFFSLFDNKISEEYLWPEETFEDNSAIISAASSEFEKEDTPDVEILKLKPDPQLIELFKEEHLSDYKCEYSVSWTYDLSEKDKCIGKPRFTGTKEECELFIIESKQPSLF